MCTYESWKIAENGTRNFLSIFLTPYESRETPGVRLKKKRQYAVGLIRLERNKLSQDRNDASFSTRRSSGTGVNRPCLRRNRKIGRRWDLKEEETRAACTRGIVQQAHVTFVGRLCPLRQPRGRTSFNFSRPRLMTPENRRDFFSLLSRSKWVKSTASIY